MTMNTDIVFKYGYEILLKDPIHVLNEGWKEHMKEIFSEPRPCIDIGGEPIN
jgi:hypothetical protein